MAVPNRYFCAGAVSACITFSQMGVDLGPSWNKTSFILLVRVSQSWGETSPYPLPGNWFLGEETETQNAQIWQSWEVCNEPCRSAYPGLVSDFWLIWSSELGPGWLTKVWRYSTGCWLVLKGRTSPLGWQGDPSRSVVPWKSPLSEMEQFCGKMLVLINFSCWKILDKKVLQTVWPFLNGKVSMFLDPNVASFW